MRRVFLYFCSGKAQLVERSTLMRKYPRSIPGDGEKKIFDFLLRIFLSYINSSEHRTWFAFADDPYGWATSKFVKLCYWSNTTLRFIEYLIGWEFLYFDDIILLSSDFYFLLRFANTIFLVCILAFAKAGAKTLLRIKLELFEQI